jgi:hypothetical protein
MAVVGRPQPPWLAGECILPSFSVKTKKGSTYTFLYQLMSIASGYHTIVCLTVYYMYYLAYLFPLNEHIPTFDKTSFIYMFSNPFNKFRLGWCKACIFSHNFHVRKDTCFAPSKFVTSFFRWYKYITT